MEDWIYEIATKHLKYSLRDVDDYEFLTDDEKKIMNENQFSLLKEAILYNEI